METAYDIKIQALGRDFNFAHSVKLAGFFLREIPEAIGTARASIHTVDGKFRPHAESKYIDQSTCAVCGRGPDDLLVGLGGYDTWYDSPAGVTICCLCLDALNRLAALSRPELDQLAKG